MKENCFNKKRWNFYVGENQFKTDFYLEFLDENSTLKFRLDNFIRCKYTIVSFIAITIVLVFLDSILYNFKILNVGNILSLLSLGGTVYLLYNVDNGLYPRVSLSIALLFIQINLVVDYNSPLLVSLLPIALFDSLTLYSWKLHCVSVLGQSILCSICLRISHLNPEMVGLENAIAFNSFMCFIKFFIILAADAFIFATVEKLMKENWVLRDTFDKSFKQLLSMIDDHPEEIFVLDQSMNIIFFNKKFLNCLAKSNQQDNKIPKNCKELFHVDERDEYCGKVIEAIKDQKLIESSISFNKAANDLINEFKEGKAVMFTDTIEEYDSVISPILWKGTKAAMITLKNVQEQRVKNKLLENHCNEISCLFENIIQNLEDDLSNESPERDNPENCQIVTFKKNILMQVIKIFNEFLTIENLFKIDCSTLKLDVECFSFKEEFFYSVDLLLSLQQESKVSITMDPVVPEQVEGDLLKFRLIVTSILNFALKSSKKINMKINANFDIEGNEASIYFCVTFKPIFEISEESLKLLFTNEKISLANQTKMNNKVGLSIHLVSNLVQLMGGKFKEIERKDNGETFIMFLLPFEKIEENKHSRVRKTDIKLNSSRSYENGSHILKSPEINAKNIAMKMNLERSLNEIKRTSSKNESLIKDDKSVNIIRNSMKSMIKPNAEESWTNSNIEKQPSEKEVIEEVLIKDTNERECLNTTIIPGKNNFATKYIPKKKPVKQDLRKNSDAPSFPNDYQDRVSKSYDISDDGGQNIEIMKNRSHDIDERPDSNGNLNSDEVNVNGGGLVGRIAAANAQLQKEKEEQIKQDKTDNIKNENIPSNNNPAQPNNEINKVGSQLSFQQENSKESFGGQKPEKKKKTKKSKKDKEKGEKCDKVDKKSKEDSPQKSKENIIVNDDELMGAAVIKKEEVKEEQKQEDSKEIKPQEEINKTEEIKNEGNQSFCMTDKKKSKEEKAKKNKTKKKSRKRVGTGSKIKIEEEKEIPLDIIDDDKCNDSDDEERNDDVVEENKNEENKINEQEEILVRQMLPSVQLIEQKGEPSMIERARTVIIVESKKEEETNLKMVCHVFNCIASIAKSPFECLEQYKASIKNEKICRCIMLNLNENDFDDYANLIIHIRNCERENLINPTKILCMVSSKTLSMLKERTDINELVISEKKPIKQTTVMNCISNYI